MDFDYISGVSQWGWWGWIGTGWINFRRVLAYVSDKTRANMLAYRTSIKLPLYGTSFLPPALKFTSSCRNAIKSPKPFERRSTLVKSAIFFFIALERFIHHTIIDVWRDTNVNNQFNFYIFILRFKIVFYFWNISKTVKGSFPQQQRRYSSVSPLSPLIFSVRSLSF